MEAAHTAAVRCITLHRLTQGHVRSLILPLIMTLSTSLEMWSASHGCRIDMKQTKKHIIHEMLPTYETTKTALEV